MKLTIKCVDEYGNQIAEDIVKNIECGSEYREEAPVINGYAPEKSVLEGSVSNEDSTVYLVYKRCYEVVFDPNNGKGSSKCSVEQGKTVTELADPIKEGYTFEGWFLDGTEYDFSRPVTDNITLVAKWTAIQYTIMIVGEGVTVKNGDIVISNGDKVDHGTELTIMIAEKDGYTDTVKIGETVVSGSWKVTEDITVTGIYTKNTEDSDSNALIITGVAAVIIIVAITGFFIINRR